MREFMGVMVGVLGFTVWYLWPIVMYWRGGGVVCY